MSRLRQMGSMNDNPCKKGRGLELGLHEKAADELGLEQAEILGSVL